MKKSKLGQFYTPENISEVMAQLTHGLTKTPPTNVIDMACGTGSLLKPIEKIWPNSEIHALDIDQNNIDYLANNHPNWKSLCRDSLEHKFQNNFYDLAIGNPPYIKTKATKDIVELLHRNFECKGIQENSTIRVEIAFIAKYLESTKIDGIISLIVPEAIISNEKLSFVRDRLLKQLSQITVLEIPLKHFDHADVRTYLITGIKAVVADDTIRVGKISEDGHIQDLLTLNKTDARSRFDYKYLRRLPLFRDMQLKYKTLGELTHKLRRGNKTKIELEKVNICYFHSTSFKHLRNGMAHLEGEMDLMNACNPLHIAKKGDILIPRIGRNCHLEQATVIDGNAIITDSIFKIESQKYSDEVYETLNSTFGQEWRKSHASGSCTKVLTQKVIASMPIIGLNR